MFKINNNFAATAICGQNNANKKTSLLQLVLSKENNLEIKNLELVDSYPLNILSQHNKSMQEFRS